MEAGLKKELKNIYHKSPLLFRIDKGIFRIMSGVKKAFKKSADDKVSNRPDIHSISELLGYLSDSDSTIYGKEIIEGYEEDVDKTILLVSHELSLTGAPIVLLRMAESLKRRGYQVIIICGLDGERFSEHSVQMGIPVIYYPDFLHLDMILSIRKQFSKIIVNTIKCAPIINLLNSTDSLVLWWIHEAGDSYKRGSAKEMPREVASNIHIYSAGEYAGKMLISRFPRYKVKNLMYSVPDLARFSDGSDFHIDIPDKKVFALSGTVQYRKGQDVLKSAIERLPDKVREGCFFLFVGMGYDAGITNGLKELTKKYPGNVLYKDEIKLNDMYKLYNDIDFLVCASRDDPVPGVVAEAMSLGKPCICSEFAGAASVIEKYKSGLVYRRNSATALARMIEGVYSQNDGEFKEMSKNARRAYEQVFSEVVFEKKLDKCLKQIEK